MCYIFSIFFCQPAIPSQQKIGFCASFDEKKSKYKTVENQIFKGSTRQDSFGEEMIIRTLNGSYLSSLEKPQDPTDLNKF
jgi:hypothetical protein